MTPLKSILAHLPHAPGVYQFHGAFGEILYVGKAIDLKKRVSSYFRSSGLGSVRLQKLVEGIVDIQFTVVDSELEALILETNLIKANRPRYNILMKDDRNYVYVKVTVQEQFPRVYVTRRLLKDGARYFGPRSSAGDVRRILEVLKKAFLYRHCDLFIDVRGGDKVAKRDQAFAELHRKRCLGPCILEAPAEEYARVIGQILAFFEGKTDALVGELTRQRQAAVGERDFERAALLRDRLLLIQGLLDTQRVTAPDDFDRDVIGLVIEGGYAYVAVFLFRSGKLLAQDNFVLSGVDPDSGAELQESEVLASFLSQYYESVTNFPQEVLMPFRLEEVEVFADRLRTLAGHKVTLSVPARGKNREALELATQNAQSFAKQSQVKWQAGSGQDVGAALEGLKAVLNLPRLPQRIECYDISHLGGTDTVGSMVVFEKGFPKKSDYRHFKLRAVQDKIDDYEALEEVLTRRLKHLQDPLKAFRRAKKKDVPAIQAILEAEGLEAEGLDPARILILEKRKKIVAMGRWRVLDKHVGEIASLWVDPSLRGQDWGAKVVRALLKKQKKGKVYVVVGPRKLVNWYGALEFHAVPEVPLGLESKVAFCSARQDCEGPTVMVYRFAKSIQDVSFARRPDLLVIDGGKGQLGAAMKALRVSELGIPVISLAKQEEEVFVPGQSTSIRLPHDTDTLQLLQRLRDEAHRFALKYQRNLRGKRMLT